VHVPNKQIEHEPLTRFCSSAGRLTDRWARRIEHGEATRLNRLWCSSAVESSGLVLAFDHEE
jgi:hypothetical protein